MKVPVKTLYASYLPKVKDRNKILMADSGLMLDNGLPPRKNLLSSVPNEYLDNLDRIGGNNAWSMTNPGGGNTQPENAFGDFANQQMYGQGAGNAQPFNNNGLQPDNRNSSPNINTEPQTQYGSPQRLDPNSYMKFQGSPPPDPRKPYEGQIGQGIVAGAAALDAVLPYGHIRRWPNVRPNVSPNQHPYGTGSQALMPSGGSLSGFTDGGFDFNSIDTDKLANFWRNNYMQPAGVLPKVTANKNGWLSNVQPIMNYGGNIGHAMSWGEDGLMIPDAKSGIHIKPSHKGRFTAYKKRTGQTTAEALKSKNPHVRAMANFANNASHWNKKVGGGPVAPGGGGGTPGIISALQSPTGLSGSMYGRVPSHVDAGPTKVKHKKLKFDDGGPVPKKKLVAHADSQRHTTTQPQPYGNRYVTFPYGSDYAMPTTMTVDLQSKRQIPAAHNDRSFVNMYNTVDNYGNALSLTDDQIPYQYLTGKNTNNFALKTYNEQGKLAKTDSLYLAPGASDYNIRLPQQKYGGTIEEAKSGWLSGAVNPAHKGYCTPMTKSTCTPRRKAFAKRAKAHNLEIGGPIGDGPIDYPTDHLGQQLKKGKWHSPPNPNRPHRKFKSGGSLSASKAAEILHDGTAHGHKLTDKQRRFMGWKSNQKGDFGFNMGDPTKPLPPAGMKQTGTLPYTPQDRSDAYFLDDVNRTLATGHRANSAGYSPMQEKISNDAYMWRRINGQHNNVQQNIQGYFNRPIDRSDSTSMYRAKLNTIGYGAGAMYNTTPNMDVRNPVPINSNQSVAHMEHGGMMRENDRMWNMYNSGGHFMDTTVWEHGGYAEGGSMSPPQINTHWGGNAELTSYNPYDGGTVQFNGPSHDNGGIGVSANGKQVEVEGGETATKGVDGSINVGGNMKVPATNTRFKTAFKEISEKELAFDKLKTAGTNTVNSLDPKNKYDQIKFNAAELMMKGGDMGQKELAGRKQQLTDLQNAMLDTAQEHNLDPQGMSAGIIKKAKKGTFIAAQTNMSSTSNLIKKAPWGVTIPQNSVNDNTGPRDGSVELTRSDRNNNPGNIKYSKYAKEHGASGQDKDGFAIFPDPTLGHTAMYNLLTGDNYKNFSVKGAITKWTGGKPYDLSGLGDLNNKKISQLAPDELSHVMDYMRNGEGTSYGAGIPRNYTNITPSGTPTESTPPLSINPITPIGLPSAPAFTTPTPEAKPAPPVQPQYSLGPVSPKKPIPTQAKPLGFGDVASDIFAIATNHERPVYGQRYTPQLYQPYQISEQDRINANQESFNDVKRLISPSNPAALGTLAGQKYNADNQVRADEFRTNQGISNQVYNENVGLTNNAQLENLRLADTQYTRQEGANAKTREMNQMIVNSISDKYNAVKYRNNELKAYENLYNYRLQPNAQGGNDEVNYNPAAQFQFSNRPESGSGENENTRRTTTYNPNGTVKNYKDTKDNELISNYRELRNEMMKRKLDPSDPNNIKFLHGGQLALLPAPKLFRGGYIKNIS